MVFHSLNLGLALTLHRIKPAPVDSAIQPLNMQLVLGWQLPGLTFTSKSTAGTFGISPKKDSHGFHGGFFERTLGLNYD